MRGGRITLLAGAAAVLLLAGATLTIDFVHRQRLVVEITNHSSSIEAPKLLVVGAEPCPKVLTLPPLPGGATITADAQTCTAENELHLEYVDSLGAKHHEILIGYYQPGYCGSVTAEITTSNHVNVTKEDIRPGICLPWPLSRLL